MPMGTERSADVPAGYDEEDPYADADIDALDPWWRENIRVFSEHGMRPYRPPQFADGMHTPVVLDSLEEELGVSVRLRTLNPQDGGEWEVLVEDEPVGSIGRYRDDGGFSVYTINADEFIELVLSSVK